MTGNALFVKEWAGRMVEAFDNSNGNTEVFREECKKVQEWLDEPQGRLTEVFGCGK